MKSLKHFAIIAIAIPFALIIYGMKQPDASSNQPLKQNIAAVKLQPKISAEQGHKIAKDNGCFACHSIDGTKKVGPTWKNLYGHKVQLKNGSTAIADSAYLHKAIVDPNAEIVKGFYAVMPSYSYLESAKIKSIIAYIKSLSDKSSAK
jgi:cytochrome c oxidase subunit 2